MASDYDVPPETLICNTAVHELGRKLKTAKVIPTRLVISSRPENYQLKRGQDIHPYNLLQRNITFHVFFTLFGPKKLKILSFPIPRDLRQAEQSEYFQAQ